MKSTWKTPRKLFDNLKAQPRRYHDAVSSRNILGQVRGASPRIKGKSAVPDTIRVLALKVQFQLDSDTNTTGDGHFDYFGNGQAVYVNGDPAQGHNLEYEPPHDSTYIHNQLLALRNYYLAVSDSQLYIDFEQWPRGSHAAYDMPHQMSFYSDFYNYQQNWGAGIYTLLRDAVSAADRDTCQFSYQRNGSKVTKAVLLFHAGSVWQTDPWGADLPAVFIKLEESSPIIARNGADTIYEGIIDAETQSQDGMVLGSQGEIAHEFGHQLGLPDLYDVEYNSVGLGEWELMSHGSWNLNAYVPPHLSAWCKFYLGWARPVTLQPGDNVQQAFKWVAKNIDAMVKVPINTHEYYLIENRRAWTNPNTVTDFSDSIAYGYGSDHNGIRTYRNGVLVKMDDYDMSLPFELGAGGLLVWHVDDSLVQRRLASNMLEVGDTKAIHLEEADHVQDLQRWGGSPFDTYASPYDAYYAGNNDRLDDGSMPSTAANDGSSTHISIFNVSAPAESMSARVTVGNGLPGFPAAMGGPCDWNSPNTAVLGDTLTVLLLPDNDGTLYAWKMDGKGLYNHDTTLVRAGGLDTIRLHAEFAAVPAAIYSSPAVADVDRDSQPEVFIAGAISQTEGAVYGFRFAPQTVTYLTAHGDTFSVRHATSLAGWPKTIHGPIYSSVTLGDVNHDDTLEVIVAGDDRKLHVWKYDSPDSTELDSFPKDLTMETRSTAAVADIDPAYPGNEIVILSGDSRVFAFRGNGANVPGFPALTPWVDWVSSSPAVADVDRDGQPEIVACNKKGIHVLDRHGNELPGWAVAHDEIAVSSPAVGDIDGNGCPDIAVAIGTKLYAYNYNGTVMSGFPVTLAASAMVQSSPAAADIDGDGKQEIIIGSPDGTVQAFGENGQPVAGYPLTLGGKTLSSPLVLGVTAAIGSDDGKLNVWTVDVAGSADWPGFHHDACHTGFADWILSGHPLAARSGGLLQNAYVYPNPAKAAPVRIRYYLTAAARVDIKVFNVAGDLVRQFTQDGQAATDNEYVWDLENIATGTYVARVEAKGNSGTAYKLCKFAVIK